MKQRISSAFLATALFVLAVGSALAEDIDIFSANTNVTTGAPNVLIILDSSANWSQSFSSSTKFAAEKIALATVVNALKTQFNLGLMMYTETGNPNSNLDGGYVRFAIQGMTDTNAQPTAARICLLQMVGSGTGCTISNPYYSNFDISADKANAGIIGKTMVEAYDYFAGLLAYAGKDKQKADPTAFVGGVTTGSAAKYLSPIASGSCARNYIIVINNGPFQDAASDTAAARTQLSAAGGNTTVINPPDNGTSQDNLADEWVRFLNKDPTINAVTYALEVGPSTTGQGPYNTQLLQSMGRQGEGGYYSAADAASLNLALTRIFNDIQARNSVFASASLPLSADQSGAYSDQIYMGVFRPDSNPRWFGNLKQYKFSVDANSNLTVTGADDLPVAGTTGLAQPDAVSFWTSKDTSVAPDAAATPATSSTTGSTGGFWYFDAKGSGGSYDKADGEWVEKGGAAQQLRLAYLGYANRGGIGDTNASTLNSLPARQLFTCTTACISGGSGTALSGTPFDTSNSDITDAALGVSSKTVTSIASASSKTLTSIVVGTAVAISSITDLGSKVIQVTTTFSHGYTTGNTVNIQGTSSAYDDCPVPGTCSTITVTGATTFTFTKSSGSTPNLGAGGNVYKNSTSAAATSSVAHGFVVGERITVAGMTAGFGGIVIVTSVPDSTHFNYTLATATAGAAATAGTATSNTATATATAHGFATGTSVTISGATPLGYNGVWVVTSTGADTFTYSYTSAAPLAASSGTIVASVGGGRTTLIRWVRGMDTQDENGFKVNGADTDVRASIHADVLHSRPVVINYGSPSTGDNPYIFYGGNDGVFRAVKGGQAATDGKEQWGFIPTEFFGRLKRIYDNSPAVLYTSTTPGLIPTPTSRDYFWDGQTSTYVVRDTTTGALTKALLFITARRGGRFIYALDVTTVGSPKFLWKKGCTTAYPDNSGCDAGFTELAQAWSTPVAVKVAANTNPVLIFGGGYHAAAEDAEPPTTNLVGRAVFVLDAYTGALLFTAGHATGAPVAKSVTGMDFSFPADVLALDRNQTGFVNRVYAADVGGNVWRIDTGDATMSNWTISKVASLADRSTVAGTRKFFFGPDVVVGESYDGVIIASGDREHPLKTNGAQSVTNRVYMIKDTNTVSVGTDLPYADPSNNNSSSSSCTSPCLYDATNSSTVPATAGGWYVTLRTGEKAVNGPIVVSGEVIFGTNQPDLSNTTCVGNLGIARRYDISFLTGAAGSLTDAGGLPIRSQEIGGGGFLPSPIAGMVNIGGTTYPFLLDNPLSSPDPPPLTFDVPARRFRTHWRELLE